MQHGGMRQSRQTSRSSRSAQGQALLTQSACQLSSSTPPINPPDFCEMYSHAERLAFADRRALRGQPAGARADPPALALAIEPNQMIGGAVAW